jgi:hypothetical protein
MMKNRTYQHLIQAAVPYMAVIIGLYFCHHAWTALLLYHFQIILCACFFKADIRNLLFAGFSLKCFLFFVLPLLFLGPFLYLILPYMINDGVVLKEWLQGYGVSQKSFIILFPYFCTIHPLLEEIHWGKFRKLEKQQDMLFFFFAGYHILVLATLLSYIWLIIGFIVLIIVAWLWAMLFHKLRGGIIPFFSHIAADIGIISAAYVIAFR